jgi:3',5'-cyclic AMP phosphodiesterase CpdA
MSKASESGIDRRGALECMAWAGTGLLWTMVGGVPQTSKILGIENAQAATTGLSFVQISDSHIGFAKPANPNPSATLEEAIGKIAALGPKPDFILHTGDITHLSKPAEFDIADQLIGKGGLFVHTVPGEHDIVDEGNGKAYLERYGSANGPKGSGYYSFDHKGVHFIGLVNVADLAAGGLGSLGKDQIAWLAADLEHRARSTPIVVFAHIPLWVVYKEWGWGTADAEQALALLKPFGSVTVLNGHIHQLMQKVEGRVTFHTARSTAFPQPAPGTAPSPGPQTVPADRLRNVLGITSVTIAKGDKPLAIVDSSLAT